MYARKNIDHVQQQTAVEQSTTNTGWKRALYGQLQQVADDSPQLRFSYEAHLDAAKDCATCNLFSGQKVAL